MARRPGRATRHTAPPAQPPSAADLDRVEAGLPDSKAATTRSPFMPDVPINADPAWHLARRVAPGVSLQVVADIRRLGRATWLNQQLKPASIPDPVCNAILAKIPAASMPAPQAVIS